MKPTTILLLSLAALATAAPTNSDLIPTLGDPFLGLLSDDGDVGDAGSDGDTGSLGSTPLGTGLGLGQFLQGV